jgi:hypothetical protein
MISILQLIMGMLHIHWSKWKIKALSQACKPTDSLIGPVNIGPFEKFLGNQT